MVFTRLLVEGGHNRVSLSSSVYPYSISLSVCVNQIVRLPCLSAVNTPTRTRHAGCVLEASGPRLGTRRSKLELQFLGAAAGWCPGHASRLRFGDYGASTERA